MIGLGMVGLGIMVVYFLLKFLFKKNVVDRSGLIEITQNDQPELFNFIRRITVETKTPFPKKIYLSANVNAGVFYDSSFWSMFFPVRKNLQIGLGLVNSVNISELKAILAHEFGHFSQRSMKFGSYIYNVNNIIYNMLFDNDSYREALESWAGTSGYFAIFASITARIVGAIQWIMRKVYVVVNKSYLGLSREMEFHADAVAAYVSGSNPLISSLQRLAPADICYNNLLNYYDTLIPENLKALNAYSQHTEVMKHFASDYKIPFNNGLLQGGSQFESNFQPSRIIIKDQWASHPSTRERVQNLKEIALEVKIINDPAWSVFKDPLKLQEFMTDKIYTSVKFEQAPTIFDNTVFCEKYVAEIEKTSYDKAYQGYYDSRNVTYFDIQTVSQPELAATFDTLLNEHRIGLPVKARNLQTEISTLESILPESSGIKSFDFDGRKYKKEEAEKLIAELNTELTKTQEELDQSDQKLFLFFKEKAIQKGKDETLINFYDQLFLFQKKIEEDYAIYDDIIATIRPIYVSNMPFDTARSIVANVKSKEPKIKKRLNEILEDSTFAALLNENKVTRIKEYISQDLPYFIEPMFIKSDLALFMDAMNIYLSLITERIFSHKKALLKFQLELLN
jgi:Zn-dependent protease with chaperone function